MSQKQWNRLVAKYNKAVKDEVKLELEAFKIRLKHNALTSKDRLMIQLGEEVENDERRMDSKT